MKYKSMILAVAMATGFASLAQAQVTVNLTGATAFRAATINSIIAGYGGTGSVRIIHSNTANSAASAAGANAISFRGTWPGVGETIIRCRFSGSTEGIRDLVGTVVPGTPNDVLFYNDADIPALNGTILFTNNNTNPTVGGGTGVGATVANAATALKPDLAWSDVQQNSSPYRSPVLGPADSRVGVVTFVPVKSQGSSANLTNLTDQAWGALLRNQRGVPLNVFTGVSADAPGRVLGTGRNDGSGTRAAGLIETGYGVSRLVNQFKIGASGFNGVSSAGSTPDQVLLLQLWPSSDAENPDNNSVLWNSLTNGNGGYFSGSGVTGLLTKDTSSVRVLGPGGTDLTSSGSYVGTTSAAPRAVSVVSIIGTGDAVGAIAANNPGSGTGGAGLLSYNGTTITPISGTVGLSDLDRHKVTNGHYTLWTYERLFNRGTLSTNQNDVVYTAVTGIVSRIPAALGATGIPTGAMIATRTNDGDVVIQP